MSTAIFVGGKTAADSEHLDDFQKGEQKIDSISLNPDTVIKTTAAILEKEQH